MLKATTYNEVLLLLETLSMNLISEDINVDVYIIKVAKA